MAPNLRILIVDANRVRAAIIEEGLRDNIRNVTGSATAGIDPLELLDARPHARAWHHHILNDRSLYGLPRKFNVAFDGAGSIATLEDTNDIGFQAIDVTEGASFEGQAIPPGIWYRLALGGITGNKDLARDTGVIVAPSDAIAVGRDRARLHRQWEPHRPQQVPAEIRARCLGLRHIPRSRQGKARSPPDPAR